MDGWAQGRDWEGKYLVRKWRGNWLKENGLVSYMGADLVKSKYLINSHGEDVCRNIIFADDGLFPDCVTPLSQITKFSVLY